MGLLLSLIAGLSLLNPTIPVDIKSAAVKDSSNIEIERKIRKDYSLDSFEGLSFGIFPNDTTLNILGAYSSWCDSLKLNYYGIKRTAQRDHLNSDSLLAKTMHHELTHYRVDKIQERLGIKPVIESEYAREIIRDYSFILNAGEPKEDSIKILFKKFVNKGHKDLTNIILDKMVNEGIALYYDDPNFVPGLKIPSLSIGDIKTPGDLDVCVYYIGWDLMYPIISAHGEEGVEYVLKNMPKYEDFSNLEGYKKRIMKGLAEEEKRNKKN